MNLPNLRMVSNEYLAAIRTRATAPVNLSDKRLQDIAQIMQEYERRGYTATEFAYCPVNKSGLRFLHPSPENE